MTLSLLKKVCQNPSEDGRYVIKYILKTKDNLVVEFSYINKNDGKDIICVPCQTMCSMGCQFCHTKEYIGRIKNRNLTSLEITEGVDIIFYEPSLYQNNRSLLISFMGCGEPLFNVKHVVDSMVNMKSFYESMGVPLVRFAIATSLPKTKWYNFFELTRLIQKEVLPVKMHLSLHYTDDLEREKWMPFSLDIKSSLSALNFYNKVTSNAIEIHYTLIEGVNDRIENALELVSLISWHKMDVNVKFLYYNEKPNIEFKHSDSLSVSKFMSILEGHNIKTEYYVPPGLEIGASCGQFLLDYYVEFQNSK